MIKGQFCRIKNFAGNIAEFVKKSRRFFLERMDVKFLERNGKAMGLAVQKVQNKHSQTMSRQWYEFQQGNAMSFQDQLQRYGTLFSFIFSQADRLRLGCSLERSQLFFTGLLRDLECSPLLKRIGICLTNEPLPNMVFVGGQVTNLEMHRRLGLLVPVIVMTTQEHTHDSGTVDTGKS